MLWQRRGRANLEARTGKVVFIYLLITRWRYPGGKRHLFEDIESPFQRRESCGPDRGTAWERRQEAVRKRRGQGPSPGLQGTGLGANQKADH